MLSNKLKIGGSFTEVISTGILYDIESIPPNSVPPLSDMVIVIDDEPKTLRIVVKVKVAVVSGVL